MNLKQRPVPLASPAAALSAAGQIKPSRESKRSSKDWSCLPHGPHQPGPALPDIQLPLPHPTPTPNAARDVNAERRARAHVPRAHMYKQICHMCRQKERRRRKTGRLRERNSIKKGFIREKERRGKRKKGWREERKKSRAYGAVYSPSVGAGLPFLQGPLIEKVIELVTCVCGPKQRAEETNELVICPGK